jgi:hypothetical protein
MRDDALDQKDLLNFVAVERLLLAVHVDHDGLQCHRHHVAGDDRAIPKLYGVVRESAPRLAGSPRKVSMCVSDNLPLR